MSGLPTLVMLRMLDDIIDAGLDVDVKDEEGYAPPPLAQARHQHLTLIA